jgi:hypothetical protein
MKKAARLSIACVPMTSSWDRVLGALASSPAVLPDQSIMTRSLAGEDACGPRTEKVAQTLVCVAPGARNQWRPERRTNDCATSEAQTKVCAT